MNKQTRLSINKRLELKKLEKVRIALSLEKSLADKIEKIRPAGLSRQETIRQLLWAVLEDK